MARILLLGAGGSAAANVLDALRRSRDRHFIVGADASPVKLHLSAADERIVVPRADDGGYRKALLGAVTKLRCDVIIPQPDPDVRSLSRIREKIPAATFLPSEAALELAGDKLRCAKQLSAEGVAVPDVVAYTSLDEVVPATNRLLERHESLWVRARRGAGARAALPVRSSAQALAWIRWWTEERGHEASDFMASEGLPGREFAYQSLWQDGELVAGQARERLEYLFGHLTPSGQTSTPAVARTVAEPSIDKTAISAIQAIDPVPQGVYCVDLKTATDGTPKITEINAGRFFTTSNFFAAAGLNMPDLLVKCALGERPERLKSSPLPPDLYWIRMVDMGYMLVPGDELDPWPRADS